MPRLSSNSDYVLLPPTEHKTHRVGLLGGSSVGEAARGSWAGWVSICQAGLQWRHRGQSLSKTGRGAPEPPDKLSANWRREQFKARDVSSPSVGRSAAVRAKEELGGAPRKTHNALEQPYLGSCLHLNRDLGGGQEPLVGMQGLRVHWAQG